MRQLNNGKEAKPLYLQIKDIYKEKILSQEMKYGDQVDSELLIQSKYHVSRITARQAILELEKEGMVSRSRGKGTFVIWQPGIEEELSHIMSFTQEMLSRGRKPGTSFLDVSVVDVDAELKSVFGDSIDQVYRVIRVRTADDVKIVYFESYFPLSLNLPLDSSKYTESIYEMLDFVPIHVEEKILAALPSEAVAKALCIDRLQPVLVRKRKSYNADSDLMEYTVCYYRGDLYAYTISTSTKVA